jgi:hypothetical protein
MYVEGGRFQRCRMCPLGVLYRLEQPGIPVSTNLRKEASVLECVAPKIVGAITEGCDVLAERFRTPALSLIALNLCAYDRWLRVHHNRR